MLRKVIDRGGGGGLVHTAIFAACSIGFALALLGPAACSWLHSWQQSLLAKVLDMVLDGPYRSLEAKLLDTLADLWLCQSVLRVAKDGVTDTADTSNQQVVALLKT